MGSFYTNYTLRGPNQQAVAAALSGRSAVVTPALDGCIVVYDEQSDDQDSSVVSQLGARLSGALNCPVLAIINHDDDVLFYQLFERGAATDEYCSAPGYFSGEETPPSGGDARKLCNAFGASSIEEVNSILHPPDEELPTFALEQHEALVRALGLPAYAVAVGFTYISRGEIPEGLSDSDLLRTQ